jgi:DNA-binding transcriptional LysR family regulator
MLPSPTDLHYFKETAAKLNLTKAAQSLRITQPSLSIAIKRLEETLGEELFVRSKKGVTLTQAGLQLLSHTSLLLDTWQQVQTKALASMHEMQGKYVIGCHPSVAIFSLPLFLPQVMSSFPHLELELAHDSSLRITEKVISSQIDLGIVVNPIPSNELIVVKLCLDEVCLWSKSPKVDMSSVGRDNLLMMPSGPTSSQVVLKELLKKCASTPRIIQSTSFEAIRELVGSSSCLGILPTRVAKGSKVPLYKVSKSPAFTDQICLVLRTENRKIFAVKSLVEIIKKAFKENMQ